jgi:hypothetical protein
MATSSHPHITFSWEEKKIIYDTMLADGVWKNFFLTIPARHDRHDNIKLLFSDILAENHVLRDERENVLFLYKFADKEVHPRIENIFSSKCMDLQNVEK